MKTKFIISVFFLTALFACKSNPTQSTPEAFTDKTERIYGSETYGADGMSLTVTQDTVTVDSSSISNSQKTIYFSDNSVLTLSANGSDWTLSQFNPSSTFCTLSAFPGITGDTILKRSGIPTKIDGKAVQGMLTFFIKDVNVPVSVTAGDFNCTVFETDLSVDGIIKEKDLLYVSGSAGTVTSEDYKIDNTGKLYLYKRRKLIYLK
jgi:hypothetical protein